MPEQLLRWFDCVRIDPESAEGKKLKKGCWQAIIPISEGDPIGRVAQMPQEDFVFTEIDKDALADAWKIGE